MVYRLRRRFIWRYQYQHLTGYSQPSGYVDNIDDCNDCMLKPWHGQEWVAIHGLAVRQQLLGDESMMSHRYILHGISTGPDLNMVIQLSALDYDGDGYTDVDKAIDCTDSEAFTPCATKSVMGSTTTARVTNSMPPILSHVYRCRWGFYGDINTSTQAVCSQQGYVDNTDDCNDAEAFGMDRCN